MHRYPIFTPPAATGLPPPPRLRALVPGANFTYLTGLHFHLMERPTLLFVTCDAQILGIIPELEREKWSTTFPQAQTYYWQDADGYQSAFAAAAQAVHGQMIGVEGMRMRVIEGDALRRHFQQGAGAANPHGAPGDGQLHPGQALLIDYGAPRFLTVFATMRIWCRLKRVADRQLPVCCVGSDAALRISGSVFVMRSLICIFG